MKQETIRSWRRSAILFALLIHIMTHGVSDGLMRKIQLVQNAAARLITGTKRCDHITPVLRQLHRLLVRQRVTFKLACLVHQSLPGNAPRYLADDIHLLPESDRRQLRFSSARTCIVPRTHNSYGDLSFLQPDQLAISPATF